MTTPLAAAAVRYAQHGWPVFPVQVRGKAPLTGEGGFHLATGEVDQVSAWWTQEPQANIGFTPGRAGLIVLDLDGPEGESRAARLGLLAEPTMVVTTGRGRHLYFRHPGGTIGNRRLAPGIDVRADRGYVLVPPSVHPSGAVYRALGKVEEIRNLPPEVLKQLRAPDRAPTPTPAPEPVEGTSRRRRYVVAAIERECLDLARTGEGARNEALNRAAFSLARFAAAGEADPGRLAAALRCAAQAAGLSDHEIDRTIASAFRAREVAA